MGVHDRSMLYELGDNSISCASSSLLPNEPYYYQTAQCLDERQSEKCSEKTQD